jgi:hypothetical protein
MTPQDRGYVAMTTAINNDWHASILDLTQGLVGTAVAPTLAEVEHAARPALHDLLERPPSSFKVTVVQC